MQQSPPGSMPSMPPSADIGQMMMESMAKKSGKQGQQQLQQQAMQQMSGQTGQAQQPKPRPVGTPMEELKMAVGDIFEQFKFLLGLQRPPKTPEEEAQLQQFHQNWQRLDAEQQQVAQMRLQEEMQRKQMMEQEERMKKAQEEQMKQQQDLQIPQGKVSGQAAVDKMNQQRKGLGGGD